MLHIWLSSERVPFHSPSYCNASPPLSSTIPCKAPTANTYCDHFIYLRVSINVTGRRSDSLPLITARFPFPTLSPLISSLASPVMYRLLRTTLRIYLRSPSETMAALLPNVEPGVVTFPQIPDLQRASGALTDVDSPCLTRRKDRAPFEVIIPSRRRLTTRVPPFKNKANLVGCRSADCR